MRRKCSAIAWRAPPSAQGGSESSGCQASGYAQLVRGHDSFAAWAKAFVQAKVKYAPRRWFNAERFYRKHLHQGDLAFDVGANRGAHTAPMLEAGARVVALEPQGDLADRLAYDFPAATVLPFAAGAERGTATLVVASADDQLATLNRDWPAMSGEGEQTWDRTQEVPVVTIDELIVEHGEPTLLKIDTEGFEDRVFDGLSHPVPHILFEVHAGCPCVAERCFAQLNTLGRYEFRLMTEGYWRFDRPASAKRILAALPGWGDVHARLLRVAATTSRLGRP